MQALEQRVETLERELDSAISAAAHARSEKRQAEAAQKAAELHAQEVTKELENTTSTCTVSLVHLFTTLHDKFSRRTTHRAKELNYSLTLKFDLASICR